MARCEGAQVSVRPIRSLRNGDIEASNALQYSWGDLGTMVVAPGWGNLNVTSSAFGGPTEVG